MKKFVFIILIVALSSSIARSQTCTCDPKGWEPGFAIINNHITEAKPMKCGEQFSLKRYDSITLRGGFNCGNHCVKKYKAVLKNAAGTVIKIFSLTTFRWTYQFTTEGIYSMDIIPICGDSICHACHFSFTVTKQPPVVTCDCNINGWKPFALSGPTSTIMIPSGYTIHGVKNIFMRLDGGYNCRFGCLAKFTAVLKIRNTDHVVEYYPSFHFPWGYKFKDGGSYEMDITPVCDNKICKSAVFYFQMQ